MKKNRLLHCTFAFIFALLLAAPIDQARGQSTLEYVTSWGNYTDGVFHPSCIAVGNTTGALYVTDDQNRRILKYRSDNAQFLYKWKWADLSDPDGGFITPEGIAVNENLGQIFLADSGRHKIYVFDVEGSYVREWGNFGEGDTEFKGPERVAIDSAGNVYVVDWGNHLVKKFDQYGNLLAKWGSLGNGPGEFSENFSIAISPTTNDVYIGDWGNSRIQVFDSDGNFVFAFGGPGSGQGEFGTEIELAIDPDSGNIYVSDSENHRVEVFNNLGEYLFKWGGQGTEDGFFDTPKGIALSQTGEVFIADRGNQRIQKFDAAGNHLFTKKNEYYGDDELRGPSGVAVDENTGYVYVVDQGGAVVKKYDAIGNFLLKWGKGGSQDGNFRTPTGVDVDSQGNVLVAEEGNHRVQKFDSQGNFLFKWGYQGAGDGEFNKPTDVAVSLATGHIYVADMRNHRIQKFDAQGNFLLKWGEIGAGNGQLNNPYGVAVHPLSGNVYVANTGVGRIDVFDENGNFLFKWGSLGDGPGSFKWPRNVAIDQSGNVYVADTDHNRIQKFDSQGNLILMIESDTQTGVMFHPRGVGVDQNTGDVYVTASYEGHMYKFDPQGNHLLTWGYDATRARSEIRSPTGASFDPTTGRIYIVDKTKNQNQVMGFDPNGNLVISYGHSGQHYDDGEAMDLPDSIEAGPFGNIFVGCGVQSVLVDRMLYVRVVKVFDSDGNFLYRWGGDGTYAHIQGIAIDQNNGFVYIAVSRAAEVRKFDLQGNLILKWGTKGIDDGQFQFPWGIAVNPGTGNVFVSDSTNNTIQKFSPDGTFLLKWGATGQGAGQFNTPVGISFGPDGNLYVCDKFNHRVQVFDPANGSYIFSISHMITAPNDVTFDSADDLYVANAWGSQKITKYTWSDQTDTDGDGITDADEIAIYGTDPTLFDTDEDGIGDGDELNYWLDNWDVDYDGDGLNNLIDADSDDDGFLDSVEINYGSDPSDPGSVPSIDNILVNGSFEYDNDSDNNPDNWIISEPVELDSTESVDGQYSAKIESTEVINNPSRQYVDLKPNTTYTLIAWVKTENASGYAQVYPYDYGGVIDRSKWIRVKGTTDWTHYSMQFTTGADPSRARINFRLFYATGTAWFDNIMLFCLSCEGDFEPDGDVDGSDLAEYLSDSGGVGLDVFATNYGRTNCP